MRVYRGRPDPNHEPIPAAANDAQASSGAAITESR